MNTKEECLEYLKKVELEIENHTWETQVEDPSSLLEPKYMLDYCRSFNLPEPEYIDNDSVILPTGWLEGEDHETSPIYKEVADAFLSVYKLLRYEASREDEALGLEAEQDLADMHRDYWRAVL